MAAPLEGNPVGGMVVQHLRRILELQDQRLDALAIRAFARDISAHYQADYDDVLAAILGLPDNLLECARNPQGLTALGYAVAADVGASGDAFMATIH
jgi:hypothetical protein